MRQGDDRDGHDRDVDTPEGQPERPDLHDPRAPWDPDIVSGPERLRDIDQDEGEAESGDEGHHLALQAHRLFAAELSVYEREVENDADPQTDCGIDRYA